MDACTWHVRPMPAPLAWLYSQLKKRCFMFRGAALDSMSHTGPLPLKPCRHSICSLMTVVASACRALGALEVWGGTEGCFLLLLPELLLSRALPPRLTLPPHAPSPDAPPPPSTVPPTHHMGGRTTMGCRPSMWLPSWVTVQCWTCSTIWSSAAVVAPLTTGTHKAALPCWWHSRRASLRLWSGC